MNSNEDYLDELLKSIEPITNPDGVSDDGQQDLQDNTDDNAVEDSALSNNTQKSTSSNETATQQSSEQVTTMEQNIEKAAPVEQKVEKTASVEPVIKSSDIDKEVMSESDSSPIISQDLQKTADMSADEIEAMINEAKKMPTDSAPNNSNEDVDSLLSQFKDDKDLSDIGDILEKEQKKEAVDESLLEEPKQINMENEDTTEPESETSRDKKQAKKNKKEKNVEKGIKENPLKKLFNKKDKKNKNTEDTEETSENITGKAEDNTKVGLAAGAVVTAGLTNTAEYVAGGLESATGATVADVAEKTNLPTKNQNTKKKGNLFSRVFEFLTEDDDSLDSDENTESKKSANKEKNQKAGQPKKVIDEDLPKSLEADKSGQNEAALTETIQNEERGKGATAGQSAQSEREEQSNQSMPASNLELDEKVPEKNETGISQENLDILNELSDEETEKEDGKKKKNKNKKKDKKGKKDDSEEDEENPKGKGKKGKKEKKAKKVKDAAAAVPEKPAKKLPKKRVIAVFALCFSILAAILIMTAVISGLSNLKDARWAFDNADYQTCYEDLYGIELGEEDKQIYDKSTVILSMKNKLLAYENYEKLGMKVEALNSLIEGVKLYDSLKEMAQQLGVSDKIDEIYQTIRAKITEWNISDEELTELQLEENKLNYTRHLNAIVNGTPYTEETETTQEEQTAYEDILPEEQDFLPDNSASSAQNNVADSTTAETESMSEDALMEESMTEGMTESSQTEESNDGAVTVTSGNKGKYNYEAPVKDGKAVVLPNN